MGAESELTSCPTNFPSGERLKDNVDEVQKDYTYVICDSEVFQYSLSNGFAREIDMFSIKPKILTLPFVCWSMSFKT